MEEKQKILKDSHVGAFAVISLLFLVLAYHAFLSTAISGGLDFVNLCLIPVISRSISGLHVLCCRPAGHSQYASGAGANDKKQKTTAVLILLLQLAVFLIMALLLALSPVSTAIMAGVETLVVLWAAFTARRQLGGMNGDIAGWSIVWGELAAVFTLVVI